MTFRGDCPPQPWRNPSMRVQLACTTLSPNHRHNITMSVDIILLCLWFGDRVVQPRLIRCTKCISHPILHSLSFSPLFFSHRPYHYRNLPWVGSQQALQPNAFPPFHSDKDIIFDNVLYCFWSCGSVVYASNHGQGVSCELICFCSWFFTVTVTLLTVSCVLKRLKKVKARYLV